MNKKTNSSLGYGNLVSANLVWLDDHRHKEQQLTAQQKVQNANAKDEVANNKEDESDNSKKQDCK